MMKSKVGRGLKMSIELVKKLAELKEELESVSKEISNAKFELATNKNNAAFDDFINYFTNNEFSISESSGFVTINSRKYTNRIVTATYRGESFTLSAPEASAPYMFCWSVFEISSSSNQKIDIWLRSTGGSNFSFTYSNPVNEEERLKLEIRKTEKEIDSIKREISNGINMGYAYKDKYDRLSPYYDSFYELLGNVFK